MIPPRLARRDMTAVARWVVLASILPWVTARIAPAHAAEPEFRFKDRIIPENEMPRWEPRMINDVEVFQIPAQKPRPNPLQLSWAPGPIANSRFTPAEMALIVVGTTPPKMKEAVAQSSLPHDSSVPRCRSASGRWTRRLP